MSINMQDVKNKVLERKSLRNSIHNVSYQQGYKEALEDVCIQATMDNLIFVQPKFQRGQTVFYLQKCLNDLETKMTIEVLKGKIDMVCICINEIVTYRYVVIPDNHDNELNLNGWGKELGDEAIFPNYEEANITRNNVLKVMGD